MVQNPNDTDIFGGVEDKDLLEAHEQVLTSIERNPESGQTLVNDACITTNANEIRLRSVLKRDRSDDGSLALVSKTRKRVRIDEVPSRILYEREPSLSPDYYVFNFGKHKSFSLFSVARNHPTYIDWLLDCEIYGGNPALESALFADKHLTEPPRHIDIDEKVMKTWKIPVRPDVVENPCFYCSYKGRWRLRGIHHGGAVEYFGLSSNLLKEARLWSRRWSGHKTWFLYEVYACAEHFGTLVGETVQDALRDFLEQEKDSAKLYGSTFCS